MAKFDLFLGKDGIIDTDAPSITVMELEPQFNKGVGETFTTKELTKNLSKYVTFENPSVWIGYDSEKRIVDLSVCEGDTPRAVLKRITE